MNRFSLLPLISAGLALLFLAAIPIVFSAEDGVVVEHAPITSCVPLQGAHCVITGTSEGTVIIPNTQWITGGDPVVEHALITSCVATDTENGTCCPLQGAHCVIAGTSEGTVIIPNTQWITGGDPCP